MATAGKKRPRGHLGTRDLQGTGSGTQGAAGTGVLESGVRCCQQVWACALHTVPSVQPEMGDRTLDLEPGMAFLPGPVPGSSGPMCHNNQVNPHDAGSVHRAVPGRHWANVPKGSPWPEWWPQGLAVPCPCQCSPRDLLEWAAWSQGPRPHPALTAS